MAGHPGTALIESIDVEYDHSSEVWDDDLQQVRGSVALGSSFDKVEFFWARDEGIETSDEMIMRGFIIGAWDEREEFGQGSLYSQAIALFGGIENFEAALDSIPH